MSREREGEGGRGREGERDSLVAFQRAEAQGDLGGLDRYSIARSDQ